MQIFKKKVYTLYYDEDIPVGPTVDAILWNFSYVSAPGIIGHVLSISAPGNSPLYASVTSNGTIATWIGSTVNIQVLAYTGDDSEIYSSITVTRQLRVSPYTIEPVSTAGGECIITNNNINLTIPDYDPAYQYTILGVVEPCFVFQCATYDIPPGTLLNPNTVTYIDCDGIEQTISVFPTTPPVICAREILSYGYNDLMEPLIPIQTSTICTIEPWDSLTSPRESAVISSSSDAFITEACGFNLTGTLPDFFIATQFPGVLSVGDRVFMSDLPGVIPFDGTKLGIPNYWALYLTEGIEACTFGLNQVALIDYQGFIIEVQCCSI